MKALNKTASVTFGKIIALLDHRTHFKLNRSGDTFMPLSVEKLRSDVHFAGETINIYSFSHYYEQNGDLVPDPDMTFAVVQSPVQNPAARHQAISQPLVIPLTFQNSMYYTEAVYFQNGKWLIHPAQQRDLADFANNWLRNLKWQQDL
jgi:hypothetical protein